MTRRRTGPPTETLRAPAAPALDPRAPHAPSCRWLSNGSLTVLVTAAGTGFSTRGAEALTRWRGDRVEDLDGAFVYVRDLDLGRFASIGLQPARRVGERYLAEWRPGAFRITHEIDGIECVMDACVAPDADVELRRITLRHRGPKPRRLEITTYAEVVLNARAADASHPAFSKLFVQTECPADGLLLARRRPRAASEPHPWLVHALFGPGEVECETDRERFLGRGHDLGAPRALLSTHPLSGTVGSVLDPIVSLRRVVTLAPGTEATWGWALGVADDRDSGLGAARQAAFLGSRDEAFQRAERHALAELDAHELTPAEAEYLLALAGAMQYGDPRLRAPEELLQRARGSISLLARLEVGETRPFAVIHADRTPEPDLVLLAKARRYWQSLGIPADLVVLGGKPSARALFGDGEWVGDGEKVGEEALSPAERDFVDAAARCVVAGPLPELGETIRPDPPALELRGEIVPAFLDGGANGTAAAPRRDPPDPSTVCDLGHFDRDGAEYVVRVTGGAPETLPPAPWINVIANERFGCLVSETGAGTTWSVNSREHRLTPWFNDPLRDPHGEAWYLRDDDTGSFRSPFPGPVRDGTSHEVRHGFGASSYRGERDGLEHEATVFVPHDAAVKVVRVRVTNRSQRPRRVSLFSHQRLVLGGLPEEHGRFVVTSRDPDTGALLARSARDDGFPAEVVYAAVVPPSGAAIHATTDREVFVGRNGSLAAPAALIGSVPLDGRTGAGLDPCFAFQVSVQLAAGETGTFGFLLGAAPDEDGARDCVARFSVPGALDQALEQTRRSWESHWSGLRVGIPAPELEPLINGWLPYQTLSCRMWGRSACYQSGGAFGFRDQLQDAASLVLVRPKLTRAQIVLHAGHQFVEGDVLHWWHPGTERGLRTRFADDLLWLPYVASHYVETTGDDSVLSQTAPYLHAALLEPDEDEVYLKPEPSGEAADVYDHCCRAIDRSLATGAHGLPLFGSGDWNDGMNRVGREGKGESVWMGFFLCSVLDQFAPLCRRRGDTDRQRRYAAHREKLAAALNDAGWDGAWYRRGFYDDGTPLGSRDSDECQIDALVQAWSVLSGVAPPDRAERCMAELEHRLISEEDGLIRLLTPPFDRTPHDPGYIKGYVPGVRENGGQYTHAALWVVRAFAQLGRRDRAASLLSMLSPITHASTPERAARYRLEPYVVAADVYGAPPHVGRGGWSWYTGSSGWMYRVAIESVLGLSLVRGERLRIQPCIPDDWPGFRMEYSVPGTEARYVIVVENPERCAEAVLAVSGDLEGHAVEDGAALVPVARHGTHSVVVRLGPKSSSGS